jgi:hypothetical protein
VVATNPVNGLTNVPTNVVIALRTNEPIDPSSVTPGTFAIYDNFFGQQVAGTYTVSADSRTISFAAAAPLAVNRSHSVYFVYSGITDLAGNVLGTGGGLWNFNFTTGATADTTGPQVVAVSPPDQLTAVPRNAQVMIDFDRAIDALSLTQISLAAGGQAVAVSSSLVNGDTRVLLTPLAPLPSQTLHAVTIGAVTDLSGLPLAAPVASQFTTGTSVDLVAPAVTSVAPANGAQNVPTNATVQLVFSERINPLTVNSGTFYLFDSSTGQRIAGDVVVSGDARQAAFIPSAPLTPQVTYYVQATFLDLSGQQGSLFSSFRTAP